MTSKQKKVLWRIIISAVLIVAVEILCHMVKVMLPVRVVLYLIPYFIIGYDILKKALKGIWTVSYKQITAPATALKL